MTHTELECAIALYFAHGAGLDKEVKMQLHPLSHGKDLKSMYDTELNKLHAGTITVHALTYGCIQYAVRNHIDIFNLIEGGYAVAI